MFNRRPCLKTLLTLSFLLGGAIFPLKEVLANAKSQATAIHNRAGKVPSRSVASWNAAAFDAYEAGQVKRASSLFLRAARAGDVGAKYNLSSMRLRGETKAISLPLSIIWLKQAAKADYTVAQFSLGYALEEGKLIGKDLSQANRWFEKAAQKGHPEAAFALATALFLGRGVPQDYPKAAFWYEKAANAGDIDAQYSIASMYLKGLGVPSNLDSALQWFTAAARQGDVVAKEQARILIEQLAKKRET
jgi:uncharacterized protein